VTRVHWSPEALEDLEAIQEYIGRDAPSYAQVLVHRIISAVDRLNSFPIMGRVVPEVGRQEVRELIVGAFRVVYRYRNEEVEIVTVFRASRLFPGIPI